jgi:PIN domain nuclease of toxin-antitoxin system
LIYLDTHVVVWLYAGAIKELSATAVERIDAHDIRISPVVRLELQYLFEIQRITAESNDIVVDLADRIGLTICDKHFNRIASRALEYSWTRDPFDRLIVANAAVNLDRLVTRDDRILKNYAYAVW